jgi:hypothetical protein
VTFAELRPGPATQIRGAEFGVADLRECHRLVFNTRRPPDGTPPVRGVCLGEERSSVKGK